MLQMSHVRGTYILLRSIPRAFRGFVPQISSESWYCGDDDNNPELPAFFACSDTSIYDCFSYLIVDWILVLAGGGDSKVSDDPQRRRVFAGVHSLKNWFSIYT